MKVSNSELFCRPTVKLIFRSHKKANLFNNTQKQYTGKQTCGFATLYTYITLNTQYNKTETKFGIKGRFAMDFIDYDAKIDNVETKPFLDQNSTTTSKHTGPVSGRAGLGSDIRQSLI